MNEPQRQPMQSGLKPGKVALGLGKAEGLGIDRGRIAQIAVGRGRHRSDSPLVRSVTGPSGWSAWG